MKFLSPTGLETQPFKLKQGYSTLLFTTDELEQLANEIKHALRLYTYRQPSYVDRVISDGGDACGNCGNWRSVQGREIAKCGFCGDDGFDIYEASGAKVP